MKKGYLAPNEPQPPIVRRPAPAAWVWKVKDLVIDLKSDLPHADMLRYDLCFCNPLKPEEIVFPVFKTVHGHTTRGITIDRWRSQGMSLDRCGMSHINQLGNWTTYKASSDGTLLAVTLGQYMDREKAKVVAWR